MIMNVAIVKSAKTISVLEPQYPIAVLMIMNVQIVKFVTTMYV